LTILTLYNPAIQFQIFFFGFYLCSSASNIFFSFRFRHAGPSGVKSYFSPFSATFAQESRRVAVRLNARFPGAESTGSAQK